MPRLTVAAVRPSPDRGRPSRLIITETDADGRFRANPGAGLIPGTVAASPPDGQPYLGNGIKRVDWPKGAITHSADLALAPRRDDRAARSPSRAPADPSPARRSASFRHRPSE